eukprot:7606986-Pyramimonas_sp.AAC.1
MDLLEDLAWHLCSNPDFTHDLNDSDIAPLPMGDNLTGELTTDRLHEDTCPLLLKYTDIKAIPGAANLHIKSAVAERTYYLQQGFAVGRNLTKHIVNLDAEMRRAGVQPGADKHKPVFTSFDLAAAPPSLGSVWLFASLERFGVPEGLVSLSRQLCHVPNSFLKVDGVRHFILPIEFGAAQGCPVSGSAWAFAMDPLVRHTASFVKTVDGMHVYDKRYLGGCADDTGLLALSFDTLRADSEPLAAAQELAPFPMKPR